VGASKGLHGVLGFVKRGRLSFGRLTGGAGLPGLAQEGRLLLRSRLAQKASGTLEGPIKNFLTERLSGNGSPAGGSPGGRKFRKRRGRHRIAGPVLIVFALLAVLVAADFWVNAGRVYRDVEVGTAEVGGKTPQEARAIIEEGAADPVEEVRLTGPQSVTLTDEALGIRLDVEATLDKAYAVGREGGIMERLGERFDAAWGSAAIEPVIHYDEGVARAEVERLAKELDTKPREGTVAIEGDRVEVGESAKGYETDVEATLANVERAVGEMRGEAGIAGRELDPRVSTEEAERAAEKAETAMSEPIRLTTGEEEWDVAPEEIGQMLNVAPKDGRMEVSLGKGRAREVLADVYETLTVAPVEAGFVPEGEAVSVTESRDGKEVRDREFLNALGSGLFEDKREYEVPVAVTRPELTTAEAEELKPTDLLGSYRTNYTLSSDKSPERVENLRIASGAVSGTFLAPGEVFSFNELAAPLKYNETHVIVEGVETTADGGGLCQVASTLFNAANYAGLEIVERHPHFSELPYIRPGLDATVWFGALDMKFQNTTDGYVLVQESVGDDGYIYASIYGRPSGTEVTLNSRPTFRGENASEWVTYKTVTRNGEVISDGQWFTTSYDALIDEKGKKIPPTDLDPAPVIP
jgi:vancomycin resistance protein YoaR